MILDIFITINPVISPKISLDLRANFVTLSKYDRRDADSRQMSETVVVLSFAVPLQENRLQKILMTEISGLIENVEKCRKMSASFP